MTATRVGDVLDDRQVVGDEQVGETAVALEVLEQVDHLRLHGDVERRHRLVADDEARLHGERARDADALALAAGELVRVAGRVLGAQSDFLEQLPDASVRVGSFGEPVDGQSLAHDRADRHARVERRERILKDDLHLPPQRAQSGRIEREHVRAVERDLAGRRLDETKNGPAGGRLAAARLADEAERLAALHVEGDAIDGANEPDGATEDAAGDREVLDEVANREQGRRSLACSGIRARRSCSWRRRSGSSAR